MNTLFQTRIFVFPFSSSSAPFPFNLSLPSLRSIGFLSLKFRYTNKLQRPIQRAHTFSAEDVAQALISYADEMVREGGE